MLSTGTNERNSERLVPQMTLSTVLGYAARRVGQPLEPFTWEPPTLGEHDVRVAVSHCGLCHTDIQAIDNYYGISTFPLVPGHEIVGYVTELGSAVSSVELGARVGIGWQARSCGQCEWCLKGETQLCMHIEDTTVMVPHGGFSTSVVADCRFVYLLPPPIPSEVAAVLMCAGVSIYSALRTHVTSRGLGVAIVGVGGLGHLAIQFAHALGCNVTAISSSSVKKEHALGLGADHFIDVNDEAGMRQVNFGYDLLVCTANAGIHWESLLMTLKKRGKLILLGFPDVTFNSTDLVAHELSITGSLIGNPSTMREMLGFVQKHGITPLVEVMPMSRVNEGIQKLRENRVRYRIVLVNERPEAVAHNA
jgi:uncharacterized zinc-type alcohol dehydrogenase-like protein